MTFSNDLSVERAAACRTSDNGLRFPSLSYGTRGRIGLLLPSGNAAAETQIAHMLPEGVSLHTSRLKLTGSSLGELMGMTNKIEEAASLVADAQVDLVAFHCTGVSTISVEVERSILERAAKASGKPVAATSQAITSALDRVGAKRIVLLTPYIAEINAREIAFLAHHGVETVAATGLGIAAASQMMSVTPAQWFDLALRHTHPDADAYFISCTAVRSLEVIKALEVELGRPVITSNQAMVWHCLRTMGLPDRLSGFGRLLSDF